MSASEEGWEESIEYKAWASAKLFPDITLLLFPPGGARQGNVKIPRVRGTTGSATVWETASLCSEANNAWHRV